MKKRCFIMILLVVIAQIVSIDAMEKLTNKISHLNTNSMHLLDKLAQEKDPNHAQKLVRMHLKGNEQGCIELFKHAMESKNAVAQIYLSSTYYAMKWSKDSTKDFNKINKEHLESYRFAHNASAFLGYALKKATNSVTKSYKNWKMLENLSD
jgi:hypothetical protein